MKHKNYKLRITAITVGVLVTLTLLHKRPWNVREAAASELGVGFCP